MACIKVERTGEKIAACKYGTTSDAGTCLNMIVLMKLVVFDGVCNGMFHNFVMGSRLPVKMVVSFFVM